MQATRATLTASGLIKLTAISTKFTQTTGYLDRIQAGSAGTKGPAPAPVPDHMAEHSPGAGVTDRCPRCGEEHAMTAEGLILCPYVKAATFDPTTGKVTGVSFLVPADYARPSKPAEDEPAYDRIDHSWPAKSKPL